MYKTPTRQEITQKLNLVATAEAAEIVGLSRRTLEGLRTRGGGPIFVKLGRRTLYDINDLIKWTEENKRRSTCDYPGGPANASRTSKLNG